MVGGRDGGYGEADEFGDSVVGEVGDPDVSGAVDGDASGPLMLSAV